MRIFFSITFITLTLLIGAVGVAPTAHAQGPSLVDQLNADQADQAALENAIQSADALPSGVYSATANVKTDPKLKGAEEGFGTIMIWIMSLFAWLVGVAALLLDYTVYFTVVKMGSYVNSLSAIGVTWRVLRDIGNIMLIFGFLAAGIATILNTEFYGWKTKMLPMLLVAAVFINFSLFISEAIVDTGNLFATQFYTQINGGDPAGLKDFDPGSITLSNEGISNKLMAQLGLQSIYGEVSNSDKAAEILKAGNSWVIGFMGVILFMVTAFVMFSLAFVLIARFVALVFLLIVAPIGFAGLAIPGFAARAKQWWTTLLEQTITAPILLLMLYIALAVITDAQFLTGFCLPGESTITGAVNTNTSCTVNAIGWVSGNFQGFASFILSFLVAIGLLLAVIVYAKRWSAFGGDWASRTAGKLTFGATAWAANRTIGRSAYYLGRGLRHSEKFNKFNAVTGRVASGALDRVATGSFDVRGTNILKTIPFGSSIDAGKAAEKGFVGGRERNIKEHEEEVKKIEQAFKDKGSTRFEPQIAAERATALRRAQGERDEAQKAKDKARAEVDRINSLPETSEQTLAQLQKAEKELATADGQLTVAVNKLAAAEGEMKKDVGKAADDRMNTDIKLGKTAYAEGIDHPLNPITFIAYGPDTAAATRKIKNSLKEKPTKDKFLDAAKKMAKELEDAEGKEKTGDEGGEAPKPEVKPAEEAK